MYIKPYATPYMSLSYFHPKELSEFWNSERNFGKVIFQVKDNSITFSKLVYFLKSNKNFGFQKCFGGSCHILWLSDLVLHNEFHIQYTRGPCWVPRSPKTGPRGETSSDNNFYTYILGFLQEIMPAADKLCWELFLHLFLP